MKKTESTLRFCPCGADPPAFGAFKAKRKYLGGCWYIACTKCGRVGKHAGSESRAWELWDDAATTAVQPITKWDVNRSGKPLDPNRDFYFGPIA